MSAPTVGALRRQPVPDPVATTWADAREHLVRRLLIDEEWLLDGEDELTWWPWFLPQRISASVQHKDFEDGTSSDWLHLRATTQVLHVDDPDDGFAIAAWANSLHPAGAFVWRDGVVELSTTVRIHDLRSAMLEHFHNACLIQASLAHEVALEFRDDERATIPEREHPRSGARRDPDELLGIYRDKSMNLPIVVDLPRALAEARPLYRQRLLGTGLSEGWSNHEVDFFNGPGGMDVAVGRLTDSEEERRYGTGIIVLVRWTPPGWNLGDDLANMLNDVLTSDPRATALGWVASGEQAEQYGLHTRTYLGAPLLAEAATNPDELATYVVNAVVHAFDSAVLLLPQP